MLQNLTISHILHRNPSGKLETMDFNLDQSVISLVFHWFLVELATYLPYDQNLKGIWTCSFLVYEIPMENVDFMHAKRCFQTFQRVPQPNKKIFCFALLPNNK